MKDLNRKNLNLKELHEEQNQRLVQICLNYFYCYPTDTQILVKTLNLNRKFANFK